MAKILVINDITYYSYADLEDADVYNNAIYGSNWSSLDPVVQSQLLVESTRVIDSRKYTGEKADPNQPLQFPRISASGKTSNEQILIDLCCKLAAYIYKNGSSSDGGSGDLLSALKEVKVGDFQVNLKDDVSLDLSGLDDFIEDALEDWLISNSMQIWL